MRRNGKTFSHIRFTWVALLPHVLGTKSLRNLQYLPDALAFAYPFQALTTSFHASDRSFYGIDVRSEVPPVRSSSRSRRRLGTPWPLRMAKPRILTRIFFRIKIANPSSLRRSNRDVSFRKRPPPSNNQVFLELISVKTRIQNSFPALMLRLGSATSGPSPGGRNRWSTVSWREHTVCDGEIRHLRTRIEHR